MVGIISLFLAIFDVAACYKVGMPSLGPMRALQRIDSHLSSLFPPRRLPPNKLRFFGRTLVPSMSRAGSSLDDSYGSSSSGLSLFNASSSSLSVEDIKRYALDLLDVLTSTDDPDNAEFDEDKLARKEQLLICNSYQDLILELKDKGLDHTGDKLEMMIRLVLHNIDPSLKYTEEEGSEMQLEYVTEEDIKSGAVKVVPAEERNAAVAFPDCEDMVALRPVVGADGAPGQTKYALDGLRRKEISIDLIGDDEFVLQNDTSSKKTGMITASEIQAYYTAGSAVSVRWSKESNGVTILIPNELGWKSRYMRILADELAFRTQNIVIVPDIHFSAEVTLSEHLSSIGVNGSDRVSDEEREALLNGYMHCAYRSSHTASVDAINAVISVMRYAAESFKAEGNIFLAGVGRGAGKAIEVTSIINKMVQSMQNTSLSSVTPANIASDSASGEGKSLNFTTEQIANDLVALRNRIKNELQTSLSVDQVELANETTSFTNLTEGDVDDIMKLIERAANEPTESDFYRGKLTTEEAIEDSINEMFSKTKHQITDILRLYRGIYRDGPDRSIQVNSGRKITNPVENESTNSLKETPPDVERNMSFGSSLSERIVRGIFHRFTGEEWVQLNPRGLIALCPSAYSVDMLCNITSPSCFIFGANHSAKGGSLSDALALKDALFATSDETQYPSLCMQDAIIRVFGSLGGEFICDTASLWHPEAAEISLNLASSWIDLQVRTSSLQTVNSGTTTRAAVEVLRVLDSPEDAFKIIPAREYIGDSGITTSRSDVPYLDGPVMSTTAGLDFEGYSGLSTYVHDIDDFFAK